MSVVVFIYCINRVCNNSFVYEVLEKVMAVIKANEILKERYDILKLSSKYKNIMGNLPVNKQ